MKHLRTVSALSASLALGAVVVLSGVRPGAQPAAEPRVATVSNLMEGVCKPNMNRIMASAAKAPGTDSEWHQLGVSAALMNEIGHVLMEAGRCPDAVWAQGAAELRAASAAISAAVEARDPAALKEHAPKVGASCKTCHDVHKQG